MPIEVRYYPFISTFTNTMIAKKIPIPSSYLTFIFFGANRCFEKTKLR